MNIKKVAIVLVTFNRLDKLKISMKCYEKQTYKFSRMIIVNNNSSDGTKEFLDYWKNISEDYNKDVIHLDENIGGAGGFGTGMDYALNLIKSNQDDFGWIIVSDDDAFPKEDAIEKMLNYYNNKTQDEKEEIVALSSTILNHGEIHESHRSIIEKTLLRLKFIGVDKKYYDQEAFRIDLFSYVGTMIKISALFDAGTTNKDLFIYGDDNEHSIRLGKVGKMFCVTNSIYIHDTPGVESRKIGWSNYYNRRNQLYILKKYFPKRYFLLRLVKRHILDASFLSKNTRSEKEIFKAAHRDAVSGKLGKHAKYKPGFIIEES